jgi:hypothetical protein
MEKNTENIVRELIALNMERMYLYQNAKELVNATEMRQYLAGIAAQSEGYVMELEYIIRMYEGSIGRAASHKMGNAPFGNARQEKQSEHSILLQLFNNEKKAMETYDSLLANGSELDNNLFERIRAQQSELRECRLKLEKLIGG